MTADDAKGNSSAHLGLVVDPPEQTRKYVRFARSITLVEKAMQRINRGSRVHTFIFLSLFIIPTASALCMNDSSCPLSKRVKPFAQQDRSVLAELIRFGSENHIAFGIESPLRGALPYFPATNEAGETARTTILRILGGSRRFNLSCISEVVVIQDREVSSPRWLSRKIASFRAPRTSLKQVSFALEMQVEEMLNPSRGGYIASIPDKSKPDLVGPFNIKGAAVRNILCRLVRSSKGAAWIVPSTNEHFRDSMELAYWTIIEYPLPL